MKVKNTTLRIKKWARNHSLLISITGFILLIVIGAIVFYLRYPYAYRNANFYAEDGNVFVAHILERGPVFGALSLFNGYLVFGQYLVTLGAFIINFLRGGHFVELAQSIAISSYLFWGLICALPWLLFKKYLGTIWSVLLVSALWATPLGSYDYAVIGTIGNLKFAFLFVATLLVLYRINAKLCDSSWKKISVDVALLICVVTNIVTVALLPILAWHYRRRIIQLFQRQTNEWPTGFVSFIILSGLSVLYVGAVYVHGIPKNPGYLDGPLLRHTIPVILYRGSLYSIFFPINYLLDTAYVNVLLLGGLIAVLVSRYRRLLLIVAYVLVVNTLGFVLNRTGITYYYHPFDDHVWQGQFFYAGTMIVLFALAYVYAERVRELSPTRTAVLVCIIVTTIGIVLPASGFTHHDPYIAVRPGLSEQVKNICSRQVGQKATIELYPMSGWSMTLPEKTLCL